jgi:RimJ/RimL family protein N-acetyltransferase
LNSQGAFAVFDRKTHRTIGSSRYAWYDRENGAIEIGWTFLARTHWGGLYNGEMKRLMLGHASTFAARAVFVIGPDNLRSRRAVEKIGATLTENHRKGTTADGRAIDLVVYEIRL